jgi:pyridoxine/pyridoxamine 5'-phosphate oxidase
VGINTRSVFLTRVCVKTFATLNPRRITLKTSPQTEPDIRQRIWMELQRATQDRHHEWRTPVLASVSADGLPQARSVVLRHADAKLGTLQIYTDGRSPKVAELAFKPVLMLAFWSKRLNWQLRVKASVSVQHKGPEVDSVWARVSQSHAAGDYLSARAPGDLLQSAAVDAEPALASSPLPSPSHNLAIITAQVQSIDWLELSREGHRRAVFQDQAWEWRVA